MSSELRGGGPSVGMSTSCGAGPAGDVWRSMGVGACSAGDVAGLMGGGAGLATGGDVRSTGCEVGGVEGSV